MSRPQALGNIRVVDFSWVRAGPWATRWLGAFGAEIIKIVGIIEVSGGVQIDLEILGRGGARHLPRSFSSHSAQ
jgi:hypothetical protein